MNKNLDVTLRVRVPTKLIEDLDKRARFEMGSRSALVRRALILYLQRLEGASQTSQNGTINVVRREF